MASKVIRICTLGALVLLVKNAEAQTTNQRLNQRFAQTRAFDEKVESTIVDSHDGANRIQDPHWDKGPVMNGEALFRRFA